MTVHDGFRYAYATLITRQSYLAGVIILAYTLKKNRSKYPLVVCYTPDLPSDAVRALELEGNKSNIIPHKCNYLLPPPGTKIGLIASRFEDTWTKLRVFELFEYTSVCYLDADMAMFGNMDSIFDQAPHLPDDWLMANHVCVCNLDSDTWAPEDWRRENCAYTPLTHPQALASPIQPTPRGPRTHKLLNGGMFLFHPSEELWTKMLLVFQTTQLLSTFLFPDQDFLAHFFEERWLATGWQYNAIKTMRYWHADMWHDDEVICLHYIVDKPWARRVGKNGVAGYLGKDGVTHQWWWDAYHMWESERLSGSDFGQEIVGIVGKGVASC